MKGDESVTHDEALRIFWQGGRINRTPREIAATHHLRFCLDVCQPLLKRVAVEFSKSPFPRRGC